MDGHHCMNYSMETCMYCCVGVGFTGHKRGTATHRGWGGVVCGDPPALLSWDVI